MDNDWFFDCCFIGNIDAVSYTHLDVYKRQECPIVYGLFADELKNKKKGIGVIALANIITTILVIAIERISCRGK